jgi:dienelactone hydrolase
MKTRSTFAIVAFIGLFGLSFGQQKNFSLDTLTLLDRSRNREIPVAVYRPAKGNYQIVVFNHGYAENRKGSYLNYSYLNEFLASHGYLVISIQHELPTDDLIPNDGNPQIVRMPFWKRGVENICFVINEIKRREGNLDHARISVLGHSNGGDMTALFQTLHPNVAAKIITLDNRRVGLPRTRNPKIYSLRSSDQRPDENVLPTEAERQKFGITILQLPDVMHNDMDDRADQSQRSEICKYVLRFLQD